MLTAYYPKPYEVAIKEVPEPAIERSDQVKIKMNYVGICEDDMYLYRGNLLSWTLPSAIVGHEYSGTIVELGVAASQAGYKIGDHVSGYAWNFCGVCYFCKNGMEAHCESPVSTSVLAEYAVLNIRQIVKLPRQVDPMYGIFVDSIGHCIYNAFKGLSYDVGTQVLIIGANNFSYILLEILKRYTGAEISLADPDPAKLKIAEQLGADHTFSSDITAMALHCTAITSDRGYNYIFEMSRNPKMLGFAHLLLAVKGSIRYSYMYGPTNNEMIGLTELYLKEATLSSFYLAPYALEKAVTALPDLKLEPLITGIYPFEQVKDAFQAQEPETAIKTIVTFD